MRVLIVDDDPEVRDVLAEAFRMEGLDVLEASNGLEALLYVKRDRPEVREMLEGVLTSLGYVTKAAADGTEAVRAVIADAPDVVLLDVYMPGLSGVGALPTIVAVAPHTKVIMISGSANIDVLKRSLAFGAHDYVTKPFEISSLSRAIETALAMKRLEGSRDN